jgi:hypothetical protein
MVYGDDDDESFSTFYLLSQRPRYRLDANGEPAFKFVKYQELVDRPDGKLGGGFLIFDAELVVPDAERQAIAQTLEAQVSAEAARRGVPPPPLTLGAPTFTDGAIKVNVLNESGDFVEQVWNPGKPSLYGDNVASIGVELTQTGSTTLWNMLQGRGGAVQVAYTLMFWAKLPPLKVTAKFHAEQFYTYFQTVDIEWRLWAEDDYREQMHERLEENKATEITIEPGGVTDPKMIAEVRSWAMTTLEKQIDAKMLEKVAPATEDQRKIPDGIENVTRDISNVKIGDITLNYTENATVEWDVYPPGTLPNITTLTDADGTPLKWQDFAQEVSLNDPFFQQLRVDVKVNADFEDLPIHSVEVKVRYRGRPMAALAEGAPEGEAVFTDPNEVAKFATFIENDEWSYTYSYQVNYEGTGKVFQSEDIVTDEGVITVGVDDVGILLVEFAAGDINWTEVESAQVKMTYHDEEEGVGPLEEQFILSKDEPSHTFKEVIFKPFRKPYKYRVKYFMKDGREFATDEQEGRAHNTFINDPFAGRKTINVLAAGDLENAIERIHLELAYVDEVNGYRQEATPTLHAGEPFFVWTFPVIDDNLGVISYSGNVVLKGPPRTVRPIEPTTATSSTIIVPKAPKENLEVEVITNLLDFSTIKLVRTTLSYTDDANLASMKKDLLFTEREHENTKVNIPIYDLTKKSYTHKSTFFMSDKSKREVGPVEATDSVLVLEAP